MLFYRRVRGYRIGKALEHKEPHIQAGTLQYQPDTQAICFHFQEEACFCFSHPSTKQVQLCLASEINKIRHIQGGMAVDQFIFKSAFALNFQSLLGIFTKPRSQSLSSLRILVTLHSLISVPFLENIYVSAIISKTKDVFLTFSNSHLH